VATMEEIYAAIIRAGVLRKLTVVPEFCVQSLDGAVKKKIDIAWLSPRNSSRRVGALRRWRLIAAFEIEGYNVPLARIRTHSEGFRQLRKDERRSFPCYVVLYNQAHHRLDPKWGVVDPTRQIVRRMNVAQECGDIAQVRDGRHPGWLKELKALPPG